MKLNELSHNNGAKKSATRVGRGIGSGKGKTCGSGQKGQKSRSGVAINGFEGGQMPLYQRLPKIGFRNTKFADKISEATLGRIQSAIDSKKLDTKKPVDEDALVAAGVVRRKLDGVKVLTKGELTSKIDLTVSKVSKSAQATIEKAGGSVTLIKKEVAPVVRKKAIPGQ